MWGEVEEAGSPGAPLPMTDLKQLLSECGKAFLSPSARYTRLLSSIAFHSPEDPL